MIKYNNFIDYLNKKHLNEIKQLIILKLKESNNNVVLYSLKLIDYEQLNDLNFIVIAKVFLRSNHQDDYVIFKLELKLDENLKLQITKIDKIKDELKLNKYNLPNITKSNIENYAADFLSGVNYPCYMYVVDPFKIADSLGLVIIFKELKKGILGQIDFVNKIIYIDASIKNITNRVKFTILHECVHYHYHRHYFKLLSLLTGNNEIYTCCKINNKQIDILEWQANTLAGHILVPTLYLQMEYNQLTNKYIDELTIKDYEYVVDKIAKKFMVSKQLIKTRMDQSHIDVPKFLNDYNMGKVYSYETYNQDNDIRCRLSPIELAKLLIKNPKLYELFINQIIIYIDGFLLINRANVIIDKKINKEILNNIDDYALAFRIVKQTDRYQFDFLTRKDNKKTLDLEIENCNLDHLDLKNFHLDFKEDNEVITHMPLDVVETFNYLYDLYEIKSENDLAKNSHLSNKTINNLRLKKVKQMDKKTALRLVCGMSLRPKIALEFLNRAGVNLNSNLRIEDYLYLILIISFNEKGIDFWNKQLQDANLEDYML
ncbi:MAG: ImmA/IrrE family metallo-endopeptidase [Bacilli bacterium]|nr:ImmA/IrrE family metallo-endopeptidase [Bacilli bacterium]